MESEKTAFLRGVLVRGIGSYYTAKDAGGNCYTLRCKKKFRRQGISPLTGDEVLFSPGEGEEHGWIEEIMPRKTVCLRPPVANVTRLVIVLAPVPEADLLLTDRIISRAAAQGMEISIVVFTPSAILVRAESLSFFTINEETWGIIAAAIAEENAMGILERTCTFPEKIPQWAVVTI